MRTSSGWKSSTRACRFLTIRPGGGPMFRRLSAGSADPASCSLRTAGPGFGYWRGTKTILPGCAMRCPDSGSWPLSGVAVSARQSATISRREPSQVTLLGNMGGLAVLLAFDAADQLDGDPPDGACVVAAHESVSPC